MGFPLGNNMYISNLLFPEDQVIIAQITENTKYIHRKLFEEYQIWSLEVNVEKIENMRRFIGIWRI